MSIYYLILYGTAFLLLYSYRTVHIVSHNWSKGSKWTVRIAFLLITIFVYATTSYISVNRSEYRDNEFLMNYRTIGALTLTVTLLSISIFQLIADLILLFRYITFKTIPPKKEGQMKRRTFMNKVALGVGGLMLGAFLHGTTKGRFGWKIMRNNLSFDNLPKAFDGMKIVQISDLHLGSFKSNFDPLKEAIEMVNELEPDYIFFTGDLVNESPDEAEPWINIIRNLKAKRGKYAILGNHDYGWGRMTEEEKDENSAGVIEMNQRMDFKVLANEHDILEKDGEKIGLVGVENWGHTKENWFPKRGDYKVAVEGMEEVPFKILLSHDPTHWDHHILEKENVDLTLSGHTHGGQMGIRIPGLLELSAARFFYKRYAGAYSKGKQHLYVNRGMGFLIFPGRVGMPPEITLHQINRA